MKQLLFTLIALLAVHAAFACNPTAGFSNSNTSSGNNLLQLTFTNSSTPGTLTSNQVPRYIVRFGDGASSFVGQGGNVSHNYASTGTYTATMVAEVLDSGTMTVVCGDSTTASVTVSYPACGSSISVAYGSAGAATLTATTPAGTTGMTYSWDYGDTNTGTGSPTTHTYATNGYFTVTLTATSSAPCTWTSTLVIHITNATFAYSCASAHANFTPSTSYNTANFTNTSTNPTSSQSFYNHYTYYYGDGTNGPSTSHTYASAGTYTVCLAMHWFDSISNTQICTDSTCQSVTVAAAPNNITGNISMDTSVCNVTGATYKVWLITLSGTTLAAIDSTTSVSGFFHTYTFSNEPANTYRVKAMVTNGPSAGTGPLPTYGLDSLHWSGAVTFVYSGTGVSSGHNINLQCGTVTSSGPGFIGGNVTQGANKGTKSTGVPDPNIEILISNAAGTPIAYALTDASGNYSFSHLPVPGTYIIYPEVIGYTNTPWTVTLTNSNQSVTNTDFTVHTVSHASTPVTTAVENIAAAQTDITVYPNPSTGFITVASTASAHAVISDVVGHKVFETEIKEGKTELNLSNLKAGMYFINIKSAGLNYSDKIMIQH